MFEILKDYTSGCKDIWIKKLEFGENSNPACKQLVQMFNFEDNRSEQQTILHRPV